MNRRQLLTLMASAAAAGVLIPFDRSISALADQWSTPQPGEAVVVTKSDGTTLKGKITSYDKDKIVVDVISKAKEPAVSTEIPWDQINRISNGLTRERALQKWKADHHETLCLTCHGDGKVFCPVCHGTAHDPAASAGCPTCKGAAQLACTTPKCDHGTIACPNPHCLKLTDSGWYKKPDGSRWKKFNEGNGGYTEWSEHHVGQVVEKVGGHWQNLGICPICGGATTISDPVCRGTGEMPCPVCAKKTKNPPCPNKCDAGLVECPICKGAGLKA